MKITDLPIFERPREKLYRYGLAKLSNVDLLAIVLGTGNRQDDVLKLAKKILDKCDPAHASFAELKQVCGAAKAAAIVASFELHKRLSLDPNKIQILNAEQAWSALSDIRAAKKEHFVVFYLDVHNCSIAREIISVGTTNTSLVHPREVFEPAIKYLANTVLLAHNHPSGDPHPSQEDIAVTARLSEAGKILGIEVIDHIIVTAKGFLSFKQQGVL